MSKHICDSEFPWCSEKGKKGEIYKLRIGDLSPTQFAVGLAEIEVRAARMRSKYKKNPGKLHDYLRVRPVPVVIRKKKYYLVDHHHLARGLYEAVHPELGDDVCVYVEVLANGSSLDTAFFWKQMHARNQVYLFDRDGGGPRPPDKLPGHIRDLASDPYRSLAWIVRDHHGYLKNDAPFSEFKWANFFRTRILLDQHLMDSKADADSFLYSVDKDGEVRLTDDGKDVLDEAMFLASSPEARGLPGYRGSHW